MPPTFDYKCQYKQRHSYIQWRTVPVGTEHIKFIHHTEYRTQIVPLTNCYALFYFNIRYINPIKNIESNPSIDSRSEYYTYLINPATRKAPLICTPSTTAIRSTTNSHRKIFIAVERSIYFSPATIHEMHILPGYSMLAYLHFFHLYWV